MVRKRKYNKCDLAKFQTTMPNAKFLKNVAATTLLFKTHFVVLLHFKRRQNLKALPINLIPTKTVSLYKTKL